MSQGTPFIIDPAHLILGLDAKTPAEAVEALARGMETTVGKGRVKQWIAQVMAREAESSTCLGKGAALPHARTNLTSSLTIAAAVLREPIVWDAANNKAQLVFLIAVPKTAIEEYLRTVRILTHVIRHPGAVGRLASAKSSDDFLSILAEVIAATSKPDRP